MATESSLPYSQQLPLVAMLSQIDTIHAATPYFFEIHFNITLSATPSGLFS
jgi:hypothetical protein